MKDDKKSIAEKVLGCCVVIPILIASFAYAVLTWGFCLSTAWNWYMVPIFHYPPLTLLEAWVLIMILNLARPNINVWKHELDTGKAVSCLLSPWFTLLILFVLKNYVLVNQLQVTIIEKMK